MSSYDAPLDAIPLWGIFLCIFAGIVLVTELGYRLGMWRRLHSEAEKESPVGAMVATQLGLLGFLLAFTYGMAASRYDDRRRALLEETNALGTAYLRADLLPKPQCDDTRRLLREYVALRINTVELMMIEDLIRRSEELHTRLWTVAMTAAAKDSHSVSIGLFINSLNEVIDLHTKRVAAGLRSRIPWTIWSVLLGVAILAFAAMGYHNGLARTSRSPAGVVVALTFAVVIWLVADLDRPRQGTLRISQQPLVELHKSMSESSKGP